jgi:hypothetical protein
MAPLHLGALLALSLAASGSEPEQVAMSFPGLSTLKELAESALPPPPDRVYLETRTYGTVMVDHRAHLARRTSCRACHGGGAVTRIEFTPRSAHESCRACHVTLKRGPTNCRDCHVQPLEPPVAQPGENVRFVFRGPGGVRLMGTTSSQKPKPPPVAETKTASAAGPASTAASPGSLAASASASPGSLAANAVGPGTATPGAPLARTEMEGEREMFRRSGEVAFAVAPGGGLSYGPTLRLSLRSENLVVVQSVDWTTGQGSARMGGFLGLGPVIAVRPLLDLQLLALAGFDMRYRPVIATKAALGASAELQWRRVGFPRMLGGGLSATTDLGATHDAYGYRTGGFALSVYFVGGFSLAQ